MGVAGVIGQGPEKQEKDGQKPQGVGLDQRGGVKGKKGDGIAGPKDLVTVGKLFLGWIGGQWVKKNHKSMEKETLREAGGTGGKKKQETLKVKVHKGKHEKERKVLGKISIPSTKTREKITKRNNRSQRHDKGKENDINGGGAHQTSGGGV